MVKETSLDSSLGVDIGIICGFVWSTSLLLSFRWCVEVGLLPASADLLRYVLMEASSVFRQVSLMVWRNSHLLGLYSDPYLRRILFPVDGS